MKIIKALFLSYLYLASVSATTPNTDEQHEQTFKTKISSFWQQKIQNPLTISFYVTRTKMSYFCSEITDPVSRAWNTLSKETQNTIILSLLLSTYYTIHILKFNSRFNIIDNKELIGIKEQIIGGIATGTLGIFLATTALMISVLLKTEIDSSRLIELLMVEPR